MRDLILLSCSMVVAITAFEKSPPSKYCSVKCKKTPHVGCEIPETPNISDCSGFANITYNSNEKKDILGEHNRKRELVACGKGFSKPLVGSQWTLPKASNMNCLDWDEELELLASYNVLKCKMEYDACRNTDKYVGQNLFESRFYGNGAPHIRNKINYEGAMKSWFNEINKLNPHEVRCFTGADGTENFSQMIWAHTTKIGCAGAKWTDGAWWHYLFTCNYSVGGNIVGFPIYSVGDMPASQCETKDVIYKHLCSRSNEKIHDYL